MLSQPISITFDIGGGRMVTIETGKLARQADGAVTVRQGNCILLATVVANKEPKEGQEDLSAPELSENHVSYLQGGQWHRGAVFRSF